MPVSVVNQWLNSIADAGRDLLRGRLPGHRRRGIDVLCDALLSTQGDASGTALAREVVRSYAALPTGERLDFLRLLASRYAADRERILAAADAYRAAADLPTLVALREATEAPRVELFRRMNMAPDGTRALVALREHLLPLVKEHAELAAVDADLQDLLDGWFNPGFLTFERIDWHSPAELLEKLMRYEAVHRVDGWSDLKRRLAADRRCFAFFHPALVEEPLIFVQVALTKGLATAVQPLLRHDGDAARGLPDDADTAIFYSISTCQPGLKGVTLGNFLIKRVVADLASELPQLTQFATLSPIPGFGLWLSTLRAGDATGIATSDDLDRLMLLDTEGWHDEQASLEALCPVLLRLCAHYLLREKRGKEPRDSVARFHLGNGASLHRINWLGDVSPKGLKESAGLLVNYSYDLARIEANHERYAAEREVVASSGVRALLSS